MCLQYFFLDCKSTRGRAEAARRAHNPEVAGSNPAPATNRNRALAKVSGHQKVRQKNDGHTIPQKS